MLFSPQMHKPRVTEIHVRMDCNGCVQKIKKALNGINGIYDLYIDVPQQKLTIIGWADPEKIVKALRKSRKIATISSHTESTEPAPQPPEQPEGGAPAAAAPDTSNPSPAEALSPAEATAPPAEALPSAEATPVEPPKADPPPPPPENQPPKEKSSPSNIAVETNASQQTPPLGPKDVGEVHVVYRHPPDYGYRYSYGHDYGAHWNRNSNGQGLPTEAQQPIYMTHSYNTYRPSSNVTGYEYIQSPPLQARYNRMEHYTEDYHENNCNGNITSIFSDENPNACRIM